MFTQNERISTWLRRWPDVTASFVSPAMSVLLGTDVGLTREQNQDRVAALFIGGNKRHPAFVVVALADGMGGMIDGAECAVKTLSTFFESILRHQHRLPDEMLRLAALDANRAVYEFANSNGGSTLSAVLISDSAYSHTVNVGDSRIYAFAPNRDSSSLLRLTTDDNLEEAVGGFGKELLQFIGMGPGISPHLNICPHSASRVLLTSDGIHFIKSAVLEDILTNTNTLTDTSKQLLTYARWRGSPDNASLAVIDLEKVMHELGSMHSSEVFAITPFGSLEFASRLFYQRFAVGGDEIAKEKFTKDKPEAQKILHRSPATPPLATDRSIDPNPILASPKKSIRRQRSQPKQQSEPESEQLSIQIDYTPLTKDKDEGQKK